MKQSYLRRGQPRRNRIIYLDDKRHVYILYVLYAYAYPNRMRRLQREGEGGLVFVCIYVLFLFLSSLFFFSIDVSTLVRGEALEGDVCFFFSSLFFCRRELLLLIQYLRQCFFFCWGYIEAEGLLGGVGWLAGMEEGGGAMR